MIEAKGNVVHIEGDSKEICTELTYLLSSFKETLIKEYDVTEDNASLVIAECCKIAFMDNLQRKEYLDNLVEEYKKYH